MSKSNPFQSPQAAQQMPGASVLFLSIFGVFVSAALGGLGGAGLGAGLGYFNPGYYRAVFSGGDDPLFDPVAVGIGQGLGQGVLLGAAIGVALVGLFYWYRTRVTSHPESGEP
ncbi:MAG: hypothetical protein AAFN77_20230 [Planctomycetota bacterium]